MTVSKWDASFGNKKSGGKKFGKGGKKSESADTQNNKNAKFGNQNQNQNTQQSQSNKQIQNGKQNQNDQSQNDTKTKPKFCTHCKIEGHWVSNCWKLKAEKKKLLIMLRSLLMG